MARTQHQSDMNARKHLFLRVKSTAASICGKCVLSLLVINSVFSVLLSLAVGPLLWMGGPVAPSTPESDVWDAGLLFGLVTPQKH